MGHVIIDKIFARLSSEIEIEQLLIHNKYDASFGAPLALEFNEGPPIVNLVPNVSD